MIIRKLQLNDYNINYFNLLNQLSESPYPNENEFNLFISNLNDNHQIFVLLDDSLKNYLGTCSIFIESKLIHNISKIAHLEDLIINDKYRNLGYGKLLLEYIINYAKQFNCYKIILNCNFDKQIFYEKCGFQNNGLQMSIYF